MDICKGTFTPNATIAGAGYHVTSCTKLSDFNISALLDHELDALHLTLARLNTADLQNELDRIPSLFQGLKCLYISAVVASGLSLLLCIALSFRPCVVVSWANAVVTLIGSVVLLIGNTFIVVVVGGDLADKANSFGKHIGFSVSVGQKFVAITWTASAMMAVMGGYWTYKSRHLVREIRKVVPQVQRWGADF
ncbi:hypothetical protein B0T14DRAFT_511951 [Immersiella caudata]|uniref:Uncharacterized protein n=1 Tax=Immersiella caudata TaxID=314043 RepID=A0AA40C6V4_9PEZI|nr:hypothetical protein B0T14DRAFT_511951 [Immersiella caudata]